MSKISLKDLVEVVKQPDYSKQKLLAFQEKYHLDTVQFIELYGEGIPLPINSRDIENWLFQFKMFLTSKGNILELMEKSNLDPYYTRLELIA